MVVVIEMPWEIADGTEPKHEKEQHALRGLARYEAREKFSKGFQREKVFARSVRVLHATSGLRTTNLSIEFRQNPE